MALPFTEEKGAHGRGRKRGGGFRASETRVAMGDDGGVFRGEGAATSKGSHVL